METAKNIGNKVVWLLAALVLVFCSLNVDWGSAELTEAEVVKMMENRMSMKGGINLSPKLTRSFAGLASFMPMPLDAATSAIYLGALRLPYWVGCVCCGFGLVVLILNLIGFSAVPKLVLLALILLGMFVSIWALISTLSSGAAGPGPFLLLVAASLGTFNAIKCPRAGVR